MVRADVKRPLPGPAAARPGGHARPFRSGCGSVRAEVDGRGLAFRARLMAIDGVGLEAPDSEENAAYFGYAGKKEKCSLPFVQMAAMVECGTHAVVAAEIGKAGEGEDTLSRRILAGGAVEQGMVVMADAGLYSYQSLRMIIDARADAIFRVGANVGLPVLEWLPDGSYISYIAGSRREEQALPEAPERTGEGN